MCWYSRALGWLLTLLIAAIVSAWAPAPVSSDLPITRDQAIDVARRQVSFEPTSIETKTDERRGHQVWVVTLRRDGTTPGVLGLFAEVAIDRSTGQVVTIAVS